MQKYQYFIIGLLITFSVVCLPVNGQRVNQSTIVFVGENGLYVIDSSGDINTLVQITDIEAGERDSSPTLSPNGSQIAYIAFRGGDYSKSSLNVVNIDGTDNIVLTNFDYRQDSPAWSPDGSSIAFSSRDGSNQDIFLLQLNDRRLVQLTDDVLANYPAWSPEGDRIAYTSYEETTHSQLFVMDADGSNQQRLTDMPDDVSTPVWAPDGSQMMFSTFNLNSGVGKSFVINADGTGLEELVFNDLLEQSNVYVRGWLDDTLLLLVQTISGMNQTQEIYITDLGLEDSRFIVEGRQPSWISANAES